VTVSLASVVSLNPIAGLQVMDFSQTMSATIHLNKRRALNIDKINKDMYKSHFTTVFPSPDFFKRKSTTNTN
jgi:hypothetical protein